MKHLMTFLITFLFWFVFLLAGLPSNYFQTWPFSSQVGLCIFTFVLLIPADYFILKLVWRKDLLKSSLWVAFYASVPLVVYDYVYVGLWQGIGWKYLFSHWYLSIFYVIVWLESPGIGWFMQKSKQ